MQAANDNTGWPSARQFTPPQTAAHSKGHIMRYFAFAALAAAVFAAPAWSMPIVSGDGTETCNGGPCVTIQPHPAWQPPGAGQWISYADTGVGGIVAPSTTASPLFTVVEQFTAAYRSMLDLTVWADDTAQVFLNGVALNVPNFAQGTCAIGPLGCEPGEGEAFSVEVDAGQHTLAIDVYQVGAVTTGAMYEGEVNAIPLPGGLALLGAGLLGFGVLRAVRK